METVKQRIGNGKAAGLNEKGERLIPVTIVKYVARPFAFRVFNVSRAYTRR